MKQTRLIMGMPVTVEVIDGVAGADDLENVFAYFRRVDAIYSTYKSGSEISKINRGLPKEQWSREMVEIISLCAETKRLTNGYFNIEINGQLDPSGLVKGWAIKHAAGILKNKGFKNFYVDAGGDIQVSGLNADQEPWRIGIRNPFNRTEVIKVVKVREGGIATSGTYIRGQHVLDPHTGKPAAEVKSLTVIGPDIYEADRFATAAFAMGQRGIEFIEQLEGFEGYTVDNTKIARMTSGFGKFVAA